MKFLTILVTVCLLACGCVSKYDELSEKHATDNSDGLAVDLNNGKSADQISAVIKAAYEIANPLPTAMTGDLAEQRAEKFKAFDAKIRELVLSEFSVELAIERAVTWLQYEQSKRDEKEGDQPRLLPED